MDKFLEAAKEFRQDLNEKKLEEIGTGDRGTYWWQCVKCDHLWEGTLIGRTHGAGCHRCAREKRLLSLRATVLARSGSVAESAHLMRYWDAKRNTVAPTEMPQGSAETCWWRCEACEHRWSGKVFLQRLHDCASCADKRRARSQRLEAVKREGSLATMRPDLAEQFIPRKGVNAEEVSYVSGLEGLWFCEPCEVTWTASIKRRTRGGQQHRGCVRKRKSNLEDLFYRALRELLPAEEILTNRRPLKTEAGGRLELDFWLPNLSLAFEIQDFSTHHPTKDKEDATFFLAGATLKKGPRYHETKRRLAMEQLGTVLVDVWEDELLNGYGMEIVKAVVPSDIILCPR